MSDERRVDRRTLLRSLGAAAGTVAVGAAGAAARPACDGQTETTTRSGSLSGPADADTLTHDVVADDPCEVAVELSSADATDFDLYLTTDGRTPSTEDFDRRSETSFVSTERIVLEGDAAGAETYGLLVDSYTAGGEYTVEITETTPDDGGTDPNQEPTADVAADETTVTVGTAVDLDGRGSADPDGSIVSYAWDLGDGRSASGASTTVTYDDPGEYTAALTVTDDDGATDTAAVTITVEEEDDGGGDCGAVRETASAEARLWGFFGGDTYSYATRTEDPCQVTLELTGPSDADFDLYVTTDGRTPTTEDFDAKSDSATADEAVVLEDVAPGATLGILIEPAFGYGSYRIAVEELGR